MLCVEIGDVGAVNEALPIAAPLTFVYEDEDIAVLPLAVMFLLVQRRFIESVASTGLK